MDKQIVYAGKYGTTERYARYLAEKIGILAVSADAAPMNPDAMMIIHFGALYAGKVMGLQNTLRILPARARLVLVTVGLVDVQDAECVAHIRQAISRQVPEEVLRRTDIFHLRGGIDYQKLSFVHKTMMTLLCGKVRRLPEEQKTAEIRVMLETYGQTVDFTDLHSLDPVIAAIQTC